MLSWFTQPGRGAIEQGRVFGLSVCVSPVTYDTWEAEGTGKPASFWRLSGLVQAAPFWATTKSQVPAYLRKRHSLVAQEVAILTLEFGPRTAKWDSMEENEGREAGGQRCRSGSSLPPATDIRDPVRAWPSPQHLSHCRVESVFSSTMSALG